MFCPICPSKETRVIDSRNIQDGFSVRRRRECEKCKYRFSTQEVMELLDLTVVKRNGERESYSRIKLERGIIQSLTKRPYTEEKFDKLINNIEKDIRKKWNREVTSQDIGEVVMRYLKKFDKIAYIRFASIYRAFEDVTTFTDEVKRLNKPKDI